MITVELFDAPHRDIWVGQSERLPGGDNVPREAAVAGLGRLQKSLDSYYSQLSIAGFLMLVGGVVNGINMKRKVTTIQSSEREPADELRDKYHVTDGWFPSLTSFVGLRESGL